MSAFDDEWIACGDGYIYTGDLVAVAAYAFVEPREGRWRYGYEASSEPFPTWYGDCATLEEAKTCALAIAALEEIV